MLSKFTFFFLFSRLKPCLQVKEKKKESKDSNLILFVLLSEQLGVRNTEQGAGLFELGVQLCYSLLSNLFTSARRAQPQCHSRNTALNSRWVSTEDRAWCRRKVYVGFKTTKRCLPVVFRGKASHLRHYCIDSSSRCQERVLEASAMGNTSPCGWQRLGRVNCLERS